MLRKICALLLSLGIGVSALSAEPIDLEALKWQKRVVLIYAPSASDARYQAQSAALLPIFADLLERDITVVSALADDPDAVEVRKKYPVAEDDFMALLISKDGGIKMARRDVLAANVLLQEIDGKSFQKSEMRGAVRATEGDSTSLLTAEVVKNLLNLEPEPISGGYYREFYRSTTAVVDATRSDRVAMSTIYYLYDGEKAQHRLQALKADEIYAHVGGDPVEVLLLPPSGPAEVVVLGSDLIKGMRPQIVLPAGYFYTSRVRQGGKWALLSVSVAPGWDQRDYVQPDVSALKARFAEHAAWIEAAAAPKPAGDATTNPGAAE